MSRLVLRIWLPDRPGALGAVASRVGAIRGDVVGIEVVEREGGVAVDDLVVDLPDDGLLDIMLAEVRQVDGVRVEDVHLDSSVPADPTAGAFEAALVLMSAADAEELARLAVHAVRRLVGADWSCVLGRRGLAVASDGPAPRESWLVAFRDGVRGGGADGPPDPVCVPVAAPGWDLIVGRQSRPLRSRERERVLGLAALVSARWSHLGTSVAALPDAKLSHPAGGGGATRSAGGGGATRSAGGTAAERSPGGNVVQSSIVMGG